MTPAEPWKWETHYHIPPKIEAEARAESERQAKDLDAVIKRPAQVRLMRAEDMMDG